MPGVPYNATFSFYGVQATVTSVQVETPVAEIVDMTSVTDPAGYTLQAATGDIRGGSVTVDFIGLSVDPQTLVGRNDVLTFASTAYSVARRVVLESASVSARTGELVNGQLKFRITDFVP